MATMNTKWLRKIKTAVKQKTSILYFTNFLVVLIPHITTSSKLNKKIIQKYTFPNKILKYLMGAWKHEVATP